MRIWWEFVRNCQIYGVDVIGLSGMLAWLMELYEEGIISERDTDGIAMRWGDREAIVTMMNKIVHREGIGDLLANGFKEAIKEFGEESESSAIHVKNSPLYNTSLRFPYFGLAAAIATRGDYMRAWLPLAKETILIHGDDKIPPEEKARLTKRCEDQAEQLFGKREAVSVTGFEGKPELLIHAETRVSIPDMLGVCRYMVTNFNLFDPENMAELFSAGLGKRVSTQDLVTAALRNRNVERGFDMREGLTRQDDTIPRREFNNEIGGRFKGVYIDKDEFEKAKSRYYELRGWEVKTGAPTRETLAGLGLEDVAEDLYEHNTVANGA
jgi:aldehyde:ferredoxin oxidoreductase